VIVYSESIRVIASLINCGPELPYLPQHNMPCIVPDTKDIAHMPNAWVNVQILFKTTIPNPGLQENPFIQPDRK